jgi:two-component system KDP operon response regulator KdpE
MSSHTQTVLIVEDEQEIRRFLRVSLTANGFRVIEADTGEKGVMQAKSYLPDLMILDLGLPDLDGMDVILRVRSWSKVPVIVLSAREHERDKIAALDAGADDYLTKPFGIGELLARVRVALRRPARATGDEAPVITVGPLEIDLGAHQVRVNNEPVHLTPIEFRLLAALSLNAGKVLTHRQLLTEAWGPDRLDETHSLRVYMARLRDKLEADSTCPRYILTEPGVGYRLASE